MANDRESKRNCVTATVLVLRRIQIICGWTVLGFSMVARKIFRYREYSRSGDNTLTSAEWGGLATAVFAGLGLFATDRQKDFWRTTLALDLLALISSAVPAAWLTAAIISNQFSEKALWIAPSAFAYSSVLISLLLLARSIQLRRRTRRSILRTPDPAKQGIDVWRYRVEQGHMPPYQDNEPPRMSFDQYSDYAQTEVQEPPTRPLSPVSAVAGWSAVRRDVPLLQHNEPSQMSLDRYTDTEVQDPPTRPLSPVSTVAGWSTVTGATTLTQPSQAPPSYTSSRTAIYSKA